MASAFFFGLQYFLLSQTFDTSVVWAAGGGGAAALLAWFQQRRGS
jgi:hypothetical protein